MHLGFGFGIITSFGFGQNFGFGMHFGFGFGIITSFGFGQNFCSKRGKKKFQAFFFKHSLNVSGVGFKFKITTS
jgi:hypothetical protein